MKLQEIHTKKDSRLGGNILKHVYQTTPVSKIGPIHKYEEYVRTNYSNYYITKHTTSHGDALLRTKINIPEKANFETSTSSAFFVTPDLSLTRKLAGGINYFVMIPKNLKILHTDYGMSNIPGFFDDLPNNRSRTNTEKFIHNKVRSMGYDIIIPDEGEHEWIIVNPEGLIVLGSDQDMESFSSFMQA